MRVHVLDDAVYFQSPSWLFRWRAGKFDGWPLAERGPWQSMLIGGDLILQNPAHGWWRMGAQALEPADPSLTRIAPARFALPSHDGRWLIGTMLAGLFVYD